MTTSHRFTFETHESTCGGLHRVDLFDAGRLVNRRRDVRTERIDAVKADLVAEELEAVAS